MQRSFTLFLELNRNIEIALTYVEAKWEIQIIFTTSENCQKCSKQSNRLFIIQGTLDANLIQTEILYQSVM